MITRVALLILLSSISCQLFAQDIIVKGGLNLSNLSVKDDAGDQDEDFTMNPGFHLGVSVNYPITEVISFEPGLLYTTKGCQMEYDYPGEDISSSINFNYLEVPLTFKATKEFNDFNLYAAAGPYVAIGLNGKLKVKYDGETESEDIDWGNDEEEDDFKRLDLGLSLGAGIEVASFLLGVSYDLGLSNISTYQEEGASIKNKVLKISVGYNFGK